jgi:hypothetical protein
MSNRSFTGPYTPTIIGKPWWLDYAQDDEGSGIASQHEDHLQGHRREWESGVDNGAREASNTLSGLFWPRPIDMSCPTPLQSPSYHNGL